MSMSRFICCSLLATIFYIVGRIAITDNSASDLVDIKNSPSKRNELFKAMERSVKKEYPTTVIANADFSKASNHEIMGLIDKNDPLQVSFIGLIISRQKGDDEGYANEEIRQKLKQNPTLGFMALKTALDSIPYEKYPAEKAAAMALTLELGIGTPQEIRELTLNSLIKDIAPRRTEASDESLGEEQDRSRFTTERSFLPNICYSAFIQASPLPQEAISDTIRILDAQNDPAIRNDIVHAFIRKFPEHRTELHGLVVQNNIQVPFYGNNEEE